jgi:hypothetical protein
MIVYSETGKNYRILTSRLVFKLTGFSCSFNGGFVAGSNSFCTDIFTICGAAVFLFCKN